MSDSTIYLIRHAEAQLEPGEGYSIKSAVLTSEGEKGAREVGKKLSKTKFDGLYCSEYTRTIQTAKIISSYVGGLPVTISSQINERSFYEYASLHPEIERDELKKVIRMALNDLDEEGKMSYKYAPDMESAKEQAERVIKFFREIAKQHPGKNLLVVGHGNVIRSILPYLGYGKYDDFPANSFSNSACVIFKVIGNELRIEKVDGFVKQEGVERIL